MPNNGLHGTLTLDGRLSGSLSRPSSLSVSMGLKPAPPIRSYERLEDLPQINGVTLIGNMSSSDLGIVYDDTTQNWNDQVGFIPPKGAIIVYSDYATKDGVDIPNFKVGDGLAYLVDLPFVGDDLRLTLMGHLQNTTIHITAAEREKWDNKVSCAVTEIDTDEYLLALITG